MSMTKVCCACEKPIVKGREFPFYFGRTQYMCPECYKRSQGQTTLHEIDYWQTKSGYRKRAEKK